MKSGGQPTFFAAAASRALSGALGMLAICVSNSQAQSPTFGGNAQPSAQFTVPAQHLVSTRWSATVALGVTISSSHFGAPLITVSNSVVLPVAFTPGPRFRLDVHDGATGRLKYTLTDNYLSPAH